MNRFTSHRHTFNGQHPWSRCEHTRCGLPRFIARWVGAR